MDRTEDFAVRTADTAGNSLQRASRAARQIRLHLTTRDRRHLARTFRLLLALVVLAPTPLLAAPGDITTVAGGVGPGPALSIGQAPSRLVISGPYVYVADPLNNVVRRVDTRTGSEIVVAGNGTSGFSGDGGPATSAQLSLEFPSV